jgi:hypothetical protein
METRPPLWATADAVTAAAAPSRRKFLATCAVLAFAAGCRSIASNSRSTYALIHDPHPDDYRPIVRGLIEAVLAFEDPRFPKVRVEEVQDRLLALFPLEAEARYVGLQKAFMLFDDVELFPDPALPIVDAEGAAVDARERESAAALAAESRDKVAQDRVLYETFRQGQGTEARFSRLPLAARRHYLELWGGSAFVVRRQFYGSVKSLVMIAAYSHPAFWEAIGYGGGSFQPDPTSTR